MHFLSEKNDVESGFRLFEMGPLLTSGITWHFHNREIIWKFPDYLADSIKARCQLKHHTFLRLYTQGNAMSYNPRPTDYIDTAVQVRLICRPEWMDLMEIVAAHIPDSIGKWWLSYGTIIFPFTFVLLHGAGGWWVMADMAMKWVGRFCTCP